MIAAALALAARSRQWLTLLALGAAAAWLYIQWAEVRRDRDQLASWADATCAAAGTPFAGGAGVPAGQRCRAAVATAVAFRGDTERATAIALAAAMRERDAGAAADAQAAARDAASTRASLTRMEIADAEAESRRRVDRNWFAALNDIAGLRAPND